jgi:hypothetical protein
MLHASTDAHVCVFGRSICSRSSSSQGMCTIRLSACLSCLACMRACEIRLVGLPCRPSTIISLCAAFTNAFHLNCVCRWPPGGRSSATPSSSTSFVAVDSCSKWQNVASSSCVRVVFPCHEREALFSSEVCLWTLFLHSSPFLSTFGSTLVQHYLCL